MYDELKKYLIAKMKMASEDTHKTLRQNYFLLSKFEILVCGGRKEMFYLTTHSTHFIYGYMASEGRKCFI